MDVLSGSKRKREIVDRKKAPPQSKRARLAAQYHSSSEDEDGPSSRPQQAEKQQRKSTKSGHRSKDTETKKTSSTQDIASENNSAEEDSADDFDSEESEENDSDDESTSSNRRLKPKRKDPTVFAASISKILSSKLTTTQRNDPVLARSKAASTATAALAESRVEAKAKKILKEEKNQFKENGRVKDVLGLERTDISTGEIAEEEKRLRRIAQRGVIKLFNAVRAAQVKGQEAAKGEERAGTIGIERRAEKVNEMSKRGFLDLLVDGGTA